MYINSPIWQLKQECPCCNQSSALILYTCEKCLKIVAICDEMFTNFLDPMNISVETTAINANDKDCPNCKSNNSLRYSKDYELQNLGLTAKDYE